MVAFRDKDCIVQGALRALAGDDYYDAALKCRKLTALSSETPSVTLAEVTALADIKYLKAQARDHLRAGRFQWALLFIEALREKDHAGAPGTAR